MTKVLTSAQMRAIERAAIDSGSVTGLCLMQRAGRGVVDALLAEWPALARGRHRATVVCGPGNNGGDGYVVARVLAERGWDVRVATDDWRDLLAGRFRPGDAGAAARAWIEAGGTAGPCEAPAIAATFAGERGADVVLVDALLGIGQNRPADAILEPLNRALDRQTSAGDGPRLRIVAVDVPTGVDADSGAPLAGRPVVPDLCVTFHAEKPAHQVLRARGVPVAVVDIGLPPVDC